MLYDRTLGPPVKQISDTDRRILTYLKNSGSQSSGDVADFFNMDKGAIKRRLDRMVRDGTIGVSSGLNPCVYYRLDR